MTTADGLVVGSGGSQVVPMSTPTVLIRTQTNSYSRVMTGEG